MGGNGYFTRLYIPSNPPKGPEDIETPLMGKVISLLICISPTCFSARNK